MAYQSNYDKMFEAVLSDPELMAFGKYSQAEIPPLSQAVYSDNTVINTVALIINQNDAGATESEIYRVITSYLNKNV
jgi:hypothetical protein